MREAIRLAPGVTARRLLPAGRPLGLYELAFAPGARLPAHSHPQDEAWYVLAGTGDLVLQEMRVPLTQGVAATVPGTAWHAIEAGPQGLVLLAVVTPDSDASTSP